MIKGKEFLFQEYLKYIVLTRENHGLFSLRLIKGYEICVLHCKSAFTDAIYLPEPIRLVWPKDLNAISWEAAFSVPGELTHKAPHV